MIISEIKGGLGNQMFQYAFGRTLAEINKVELKLDLSFFDSIREGVTPRLFLLDRFKIQINQAEKTEIERLKKKSFFSLFFPYTTTYLKDKERTFSEAYFKPQRERYLSGYWQSEMYFHSISNILRNEFQLKYVPSDQTFENVLKEINQTNSVAIHFRKTDYVNLDLGSICSLTYYSNAIELMKKTITNPHLFIFSDDLQWVKENVEFDLPYTLVENISDNDNSVTDMFLMSNCKHTIIANSSFSWWGAWLNNNPDKVVLAPEVWEEGRNANQIIPGSWRKVPVI